MGKGTGLQRQRAMGWEYRISFTTSRHAMLDTSTEANLFPMPQTSSPPITDSLLHDTTVSSWHTQPGSSRTHSAVRHTSRLQEQELRVEKKCKYCVGVLISLIFAVPLTCTPVFYLLYLFKMAVIPMRG